MNSNRKTRFYLEIAKVNWWYAPILNIPYDFPFLHLFGSGSAEEGSASGIGTAEAGDGEAAAGTCSGVEHLRACIFRPLG